MRGALHRSEMQIFTKKQDIRDILLYIIYIYISIGLFFQGQRINDIMIFYHLFHQSLHDQTGFFQNLALIPNTGPRWSQVEKKPLLMFSFQTDGVFFLGSQENPTQKKRREKSTWCQIELCVFFL